MKIERYKQPLSSFLSVDKDIETIIDKMWNNPRLKRLLYRTGNDPLNDTNLTDEETFDLLTQGYITNVPKIVTSEGIKNYVVVSFNNFAPAWENPYFRDNTVSIDVLCHFDQWRIGGGFQLRPFKIIGEIDSMLNGTRLSGIGTLEFISAEFITSGKDYGGYNLTYRATHADEDKSQFTNPADEAQFLEDFAEGLNG